MDLTPIEHSLFEQIVGHSIPDDGPTVLDLEEFRIKTASSESGPHQVLVEKIRMTILRGVIAVP